MSPSGRQIQARSGDDHVGIYVGPGRQLNARLIKCFDFVGQDRGSPRFQRGEEITVRDHRQTLPPWLIRRGKVRVQRHGLYPVLSAMAATSSGGPER